MILDSIRRGLLLALLAAMASTMLLGAYATYRAAHVQADVLFDYHLRQLALSLRDQMFESLPAPQGPGGEDFDFVIQVWDASGVRLYYSHPHSALPDRAQLGFATLSTPEGMWRVYAIQGSGQTIQVAQPMRVRNQLAAAAALRTLLPFVFLLPALGLLIWFVVGRGLAPLERIARAVTERTPSALDPLPERGAPEEVRPLVHALNDLLARLAGALEAQRAFTADAAHELRTPLAALQLQVQLVERAAGEGARAAAIAELKGGLQRATHIVQQLLTLARQEPGAATTPFETVGLAELARRVIAEQIRLAESRGIDLGLSAADETATVQGDPEALRILLTNLIENALLYTPSGGRVDVSVAGGTAPRLEVVDTGPGIPPQEHERVFDRFYRRAGTEQPGSGLGLAIVQAVAQRHGARVTLGEPEHAGLRVQVEFPVRL